MVHSDILPWYRPEPDHYTQDLCVVMVSPLCSRLFGSSRSLTTGEKTGRKPCLLGDRQDEGAMSRDPE